MLCKELYAKNIDYESFFAIIDYRKVVKYKKMKDRIKKIRKEAKLTQVQFGEKIGVKGNTVTNYESGLRTPTDAVIKSICREFNVDENWLRTGEGDMFLPVLEEDEMALYVSELLEDDGDNPLYTIIKEVMHTYSELSPKSQEVIRDAASKLLENLKNTNRED